DSSAVTALAARTFEAQGRGPVSSYSMELTESDQFFTPSDLQPGLDTPFVRRVVAETGVRHREVPIATAQLPAPFFEPPVARDYPGMGDIDVSLFLLFREIKKRHTVAVSGESADEVFGGYPWFFSDEAIKNDAFPWEGLRLRAADYLSPDLAARVRADEYV